MGKKILFKKKRFGSWFSDLKKLVTDPTLRRQTTGGGFKSRIRPKHPIPAGSGTLQYKVTRGYIMPAVPLSLDGSLSW